MTRPTANKRSILCMVVFPVGQGASTALQRSVGTDSPTTRRGSGSKIVPTKKAHIQTHGREPRLQRLVGLSFQLVILGRGRRLVGLRLHEGLDLGDRLVDQRDQLLGLGLL